MSINARARVVRIEDAIVITNYKCMYSSLNKLKICELNPQDSTAYQKIMLYRHPFNRTVSCFLNWMYQKPLQKKLFENNDKNLLSDTNTYGWLIPILYETSEFDFDTYLSLLNEKKIKKLFKMYIEILPKIKNKDAHMSSQIEIINLYKYKIDTYIDVDNADEIKLLEKILKQKIPKANKSKKLNKSKLMQCIEKSQKIRDGIHVIYKDDFDSLPVTRCLVD